MFQQLVQFLLIMNIESDLHLLNFDDLINNSFKAFLGCFHDLLLPNGHPSEKNLELYWYK